VLTVLFATKNRASTLRRVLDAYCSLESPPGGWRLVIADNGSTDETAAVVREYQRQLPLTLLFEPTPGKNAALNSALASVTGDLILFTDDDTFPKPDWLCEMRRAADTQRGHAIFGGTVVPRWEAPPESWIVASVPLGVTFSATDPSVPEGPVMSHNVFGPNMAIRADLFARGYRFDPKIGPRGADYPMGSETELVRRLLAGGFTAWFCRGSIVEHFIPRSAMRTSWILKRAVRFGRGQYRLNVHEQPRDLARWGGVPRYLFRQLFEQQLQIAGAVLRANGAELFRARWQFHYVWGQIREARHIFACQSHQKE
jgi:L-malate glycosyltransferase